MVLLPWNVGVHNLVLVPFALETGRIFSTRLVLDIFTSGSLVFPFPCAGSVPLLPWVRGVQPPRCGEGVAVSPPQGGWIDEVGVVPDTGWERDQGGEGKRKEGGGQATTPPSSSP